MPTDCFMLRTPTILPAIRISWCLRPTFMLISGRVSRSFYHQCASTRGFRPFDPDIIVIYVPKKRNTEMSRSVRCRNKIVVRFRYGERTMRFCEMREKEVVNICTGKQLGCVVDLELDTCSGKIESIIVPGPGKFCGFFGTDCEYVIPYSCVKKIGPDAVLVEIKEEKFLQKY